MVRYITIFQRSANVEEAKKLCYTKAFWNKLCLYPNIPILHSSVQIRSDGSTRKLLYYNTSWGKRSFSDNGEKKQQKEKNVHVTFLQPWWEVDPRTIWTFTFTPFIHRIFTLESWFTSLERKPKSNNLQPFYNSPGTASVNGCVRKSDLISSFLFNTFQKSFRWSWITEPLNTTSHPTTIVWCVLSDFRDEMVEEATAAPFWVFPKISKANDLPNFR